MEMNCPCEAFLITIDSNKAQAELDRRYKAYPDTCMDEIWDVYCDADMDMCDECPMIEEYERVNK